jgi:Zn-dependent protease with chaperone function
LTKSIFEQVSKEGLHAIVAHELGHLKLNHLRKLYIINIVLLAITTLVYSLLILPHMASPYYVYYLMAFGGVFYGLIPMLILGFFQKKFEKFFKNQALNPSDFRPSDQYFP